MNFHDESNKLNQKHLVKTQCLAELDKLVEANIDKLHCTFKDGILTMEDALISNNADSFISGANGVTRALGGKPQFENQDEFTNIWDADTPLII